MTRMSGMKTASLLLFFSLPALTQERVDLGIVGPNKAEAFNNSKVMDHLYQITEAHGPRLTWSAGYQEAANWAARELKRMGMENVRLEKWAPAGRSWTLQQSSLELVEPRYKVVVGDNRSRGARRPTAVSGKLLLGTVQRQLSRRTKKIYGGTARLIRRSGAANCGARSFC